jgi:hypothetical protein
MLPFSLIPGPCHNYGGPAANFLRGIPMDGGKLAMNAGGTPGGAPGGAAGQ